MSLSAIHAAIPHRAPFLLLDEIVSQDEKQIHCRKTFTGEEFWYAGHYPQFPLTPGVLLCEAAMQAGAVLLARFAADQPGVPVATRLNDVRFKRMVLPGETIDIEVTLNEQVSTAFYLTGKVSVGGKMAARLDFACTLTAPPAEA